MMNKKEMEIVHGQYDHSTISQTDINDNAFFLDHCEINTTFLPVVSKLTFQSRNIILISKLEAF